MKLIFLVGVIIAAQGCLPLALGGAAVSGIQHLDTRAQLKALNTKIEKLEGEKIPVDDNFKKPDGSYCLSIDPRCSK